MDINDFGIRWMDLKYFVFTLILCVIIFNILNVEKDVGGFIYLYYIILVYFLFILIRKVVHKIEYNKNLEKYVKSNIDDKKETYHINYINPYITNLDNLNFNITKEYNYGHIKTYIKNKLDELLIRKYVKFYNILTYKPYPFTNVKNVPYNDYTTNWFFPNDLQSTSNFGDTEMKNLKHKTNILFLVKGELLRFNAKGYSSGFKLNKTDTKISNVLPSTKLESYIYIFEKNDRNIYTMKDNLTQINNEITNKYRNTIIDTRDLKYNVEYVCYIQLVYDPIDTSTDKIFWPNKKNFPLGLDGKQLGLITIPPILNSQKSNYNTMTPGTDSSTSDLSWGQAKKKTTIKLNDLYYKKEINKDNGSYNTFYSDESSSNVFFRVFPIVVIDKPYINSKKPTHYVNTKKYENDLNYFNYLKNIYLELIDNQFVNNENVHSITFVSKKYKNKDKIYYNKKNHAISTTDNQTISAEDDITQQVDFTNNDVEQLNVKYNKGQKTFNTNNQIYIKMYNSLPPVYSNNINTKYIEYPFLQIYKPDETYFILDLSIYELNSHNLKKFSSEGYISKLINNNNMKNKLYSTGSAGKSTINYIYNKIDFNEDINYKPVTLKKKNAVDTDDKLYLTSEFIHTRSVDEYKYKMNLIAKKIIERNFKLNTDSIYNLTYNFNKLSLIKFDENFTYNNGTNLLLANKYITKDNISTFNNISDLREAFIEFLENKLQWKAKVDEITSVPNQKNYFDVINNNMLNIDNNKILGTGKHILTDVNGSPACESNTFKVKVSDKFETNYQNIYPKFIKFDYKNSINKFKKDNIYIIYNIFKGQSNDDSLQNNNASNRNKYINSIKKIDALCLHNTPFNSKVSIVKIGDDANAYTSERPFKIYDCSSNFEQQIFGDTFITRIEYHSSDTTKKGARIYFDNSGNLQFTKDDIPTYISLHLPDDNDSKKWQTDTIEYIFKEDDLKYLDTGSKPQCFLRQNILYKVTLPDESNVKASKSAEVNVDNTIENSAYINITDLDDLWKITKGSTLPSPLIVRTKLYVIKYVDISKYNKIAYFNTENYNDDNIQVVNIKNRIIEKKTTIEPINDINDYNPENNDITTYKYKIIRKADLASHYKKCMKIIIDNIYYNEAQLIHYAIPNNIGIIEDKSSGITVYKYAKHLWIPYYKRDRPIYLINPLEENNLCKKRLTEADTMKIQQFNTLKLHNINTFDQYKKFYLNVFHNILGLHDDINSECDIYYKTLAKYKDFNLPISFNKYVSFANDYMLFYKNDENLIKDVPQLKTQLGKPVKIKNMFFNKNFINIKNSNRLNTKNSISFLKDIIIKNHIGYGGYNYDVADKICKRIYTVYNKNCKNKEYKDPLEDSYDPEYYEFNKKRDECFNIIFDNNTGKRKNELIQQNNWIFNEDYCEGECATARTNLDIEPHRLAYVNEMKQSIYYGAKWNAFGWINRGDSVTKQTSALVKPLYNKDKDRTELLWFDENNKDIENKGAICYGRKFDQTKLSKENKHHIYLFQEEEIIQNINDIKKYENLTEFGEDRYSRWNI